MKTSTITVKLAVRCLKKTMKIKGMISKDEFLRMPIELKIGQCNTF